MVKNGLRYLKCNWDDKRVQILDKGIIYFIVSISYILLVEVFLFVGKIFVSITLCTFFYLYFSILVAYVWMARE